MAHVEGFRAAVAAVGRERRWLLTPTGFSLERSAIFVANNLERGNPAVVALAAGADGLEQVVGWCDICRDDWPDCGHVGTLGVGLLAEWRGRGWGERLMRAALARAWLAGIERVQLSVRSGNVRAQRLYRALGFQDEGRRVDAMRRDGVSEDMLLMAVTQAQLRQGRAA